MLSVLATTWPILAGVMLLMVGNSVQGTLLGIRGAFEGFSTLEMSVVMSGYFLGFLFGSRFAPVMIQRVGHVRVFAALGSLVSAALILYPVLPEVWSWTLLRVVIGISFSGIYVTTESWINNASSNETRGQSLAAYMIVQMIGIIAGQAFLNTADPSGFVIFILPAVLVSLSFLPILLSAGQAPTFEAIRSMPFRRLFAVSPLGCVGIFLSGGVYSAVMGMAAVWGMLVGLSVAEISIFVGAIYVGGLLLQYPMGWISDRMDRRQLILALAVVGALAMLIPGVFSVGFYVAVGLAVILGGVINPLYALLIAHTNDHVGREEMAGASSGLLFLNGLGAVIGPILTGWMMNGLGPRGFFLFMAINLVLMAAYALWRMTRRAPVAAPAGLQPLSPMASALAVEVVLEERKAAAEAVAEAEAQAEAEAEAEAEAAEEGAAQPPAVPGAEGNVAAPRE